MAAYLRYDRGNDVGLEPRREVPRWHAGLRSNPQVDNDLLAGRNDVHIHGGEREAPRARDDARARDDPRVRADRAKEEARANEARAREDERIREERAREEAREARAREQGRARDEARAREPPRAPEARGARADHRGGGRPRGDGRMYDPGLAALYRMAPAFTLAEWQEVQVRGRGERKRGTR
jgi:hypothetical protein